MGKSLVPGGHVPLRHPQKWGSTGCQGDHSGLSNPVVLLLLLLVFFLSSSPLDLSLLMSCWFFFFVKRPSLHPSLLIFPSQFLLALPFAENLPKSRRWSWNAKGQSLKGMTFGCHHQLQDTTFSHNRMCGFSQFSLQHLLHIDMLWHVTAVLFVDWALKVHTICKCTFLPHHRRALQLHGNHLVFGQHLSEVLYHLWTLTLWRQVREGNCFPNVRVRPHTTTRRLLIAWALNCIVYWLLSLTGTTCVCLLAYCFTNHMNRRVWWRHTLC